MDVPQPKETRPPRRHGHGHHEHGQGIKRDRAGFPKKEIADRPVKTETLVRNAYTDMFESFRDDIDEHHDRKEKIVKASRDITALSKKMIFSLLRTRTLGQPLPQHLEKEFRSRLGEVRATLLPVLQHVRGINRHRYQFRGLEEYVEAVSLYHYLRYQILITPEQAVDLLVPDAELVLTDDEYLGGVFDLFGEMMRFATNMAGLGGTLSPAISGGSKHLEKIPAGGEVETGGERMDIDAREHGPGPGRSILCDMQELWSCMEILPISKTSKSTREKMEAMRSSVQKVEKLGYGLVVRGSERPTGWMPDLSDDIAPSHMEA